MNATYPRTDAAPTGSRDSLATRPRLGVLAWDTDAADRLARSLEQLLPAVDVESAATIFAQHVSGANCVVASMGSDGSEAVSVARGLRARGHIGGIVFVVDDPASLDRSALFALDARCYVETARLGRDLIPAIESALCADLLMQETEAGRNLLLGIGRLHGVLAAGQLASALPHRLNNPIAALLAEAQLLELEPLLSADQREAVARIIALSHRVIDEVRTLDGVRSTDPVMDL